MSELPISGMNTRSQSRQRLEETTRQVGNESVHEANLQGHASNHVDRSQPKPAVTKAGGKHCRVVRQGTETSHGQHGPSACIIPHAIGGPQLDNGLRKRKRTTPGDGPTPASQWQPSAREQLDVKEQSRLTSSSFTDSISLAPSSQPSLSEPMAVVMLRPPTSLQTRFTATTPMTNKAGEAQPAGLGLAPLCRQPSGFTATAAAPAFIPTAVVLPDNSCATLSSAQVPEAPAAASASCAAAGVEGLGPVRPSEGMALYRLLLDESSASAGARTAMQASGGRGEPEVPVLGSRVWIKMAGYCHWPAVVFSLKHCRKSEMPDLLASYQPGRTLVHFYGSHDHVWAVPSSLTPWITEREARLAALEKAAKSSKAAAVTVAELNDSRAANAAADPVEELALVLKLREAAVGRGSGGSTVPYGRSKRKGQCSGCGEDGVQVTCSFCRNCFHTLCLPQPDVSPAHMLAAVAVEGLEAPVLGPAAGPPQQQEHLELQLRPQQHLQQASEPQPQLALKAFWSCGACGKQNELKGPMPTRSDPHTAVSLMTGAQVSPRDKARGGQGRGTSATKSAAAGVDAAGESPIDPSGGQQLLKHQQEVPQHDALIALYEQLLAEDVVVEVMAAAEPAGPRPHTEAAAEAAASLVPSMGDTMEASQVPGAETMVSMLPASAVATANQPAHRPLPGTRLWVKTPGYCYWPAVVFSLYHCRKCEVPDLLASYQPGRTLVHFYGEHNHIWLPDEDVAALAAAAADPGVEEERKAALVAWGSRRKKSASSVHIALAELDWRSDSDSAASGSGTGRDDTATIAVSGADAPTAATAAGAIACAGSPMQSPFHVHPCRSTPQHQQTSGHHSGPPSTPSPSRELRRVLAFRESRLAEEEQRREEEAWELLLNEATQPHRQRQRHGTIAGRRNGPRMPEVCRDGDDSRGHNKPCTTAAAWGRELFLQTSPETAEEQGAAGAFRAAEMGAGDSGMGGWRSCLRACATCQEPGGQVSCADCLRAYHTLCLTPRWLSPAHMPPGRHWTCASCGRQNNVAPHASGGSGSISHRGGGEFEEERMGLTPDWIIMAGAFKVFQLPRPTATTPYIRGLLDPCTNSKANPNIPAEKLYDRDDDGLRLSNSWMGFYVILNPEYTSQTQWRFVNRAIDEVENGSVPAVLLLCRNSTDTAYFQRLRPYPRVMLRRTAARFKDYDKTPIGFGIVVFCIAPQGPGRGPLYRRFIDAFGGWGEPNIPIDAAFVDSPAFSELLDRLADHTTRHMRDTWVQCSACWKWRIVPYELYRLLGDQPLRGQQQQLEQLENHVGGVDDEKAAGTVGSDGARELQRKPARTWEAWTCSQLGAGSGCDRPLSRVEAAGVRYACQRSSQRSGQRGCDGATEHTTADCQLQEKQ